MAAQAGGGGSAALVAYGRFWCLQQAVPFVDTLCGTLPTGAYDNRPLSQEDWWVRLPLAALAAVLPTPAVLMAAHLASLASWVVHMPAVWDHMCWAAVTEACFVAAVLLGGGAAAVARRFLPAVRAQMVLLYGSAAFWKLTTSFLDPSTSCGSVLIAELSSRYLPAWLLEPGSFASRALLHATPLATVVGEFAISALLALCYPAGILLGLLFHFSINLLPVNYAAGFSIMCTARFVVFMPEAVASALADLASSLLLTSAALVAACAVNAQVRGGVDAAFVALLVMAFVYCYSLCTGRRGPGKAVAPAEPADAVLDGRFRAAASLLALAFGLAGPILGLQNMAALTMYGNVKNYGGSNHLLVPTGLLQDWYAEADLGRNASPLADAFGGGLLRVDSTDSAALRRLSPVDYTSALPPRARALLAGAGCSGRYFGHYAARVFWPGEPPPAPKFEGAPPPEEEKPQPPYALTVYEFRRLLALARESGERFTVTYVRLPTSARSPAAWRDHRGAAVVLEEDPSTGLRNCTVLGGAAAVACGPREPALLPPPPRWISKLLLPYPVPLFPGDGEEIHCSA